MFLLPTPIAENVVWHQTDTLFPNKLTTHIRLIQLNLPFCLFVSILIILRLSWSRRFLLPGGHLAILSCSGPRSRSCGTKTSPISDQFGNFHRACNPKCPTSTECKCILIFILDGAIVFADSNTVLADSNAVEFNSIQNEYI